MNLNQNFQLFKREYPFWKTYSEELLGEAMIAFCGKHNIRPTSDAAEFLYGHLLSHIPIPPLQQNQNQKYKYRHSKHQIPLNTSHQGIHQGTIPSLRSDPPQGKTAGDLNQSLQKFMKQTKNQTKNSLSRFEEQHNQQGLDPHGLMQQY